MNKIQKVVCVGVVLAGACILHVATPAESSAGNVQILTDRCSGEVAFTPTYGANPTAHGTVILKRHSDGYSPPTSFQVAPDKEGYVRWWCHSTTGNVFDPGTWRVHVNGTEAVACLVSAGAAINIDGTPACLKTVSIASSAFQGWTAERSRCNNHTGKLVARLGPDRLLTTECQ